MAKFCYFRRSVSNWGGVPTRQPMHKPIGQAYTEYNVSGLSVDSGASSSQGEIGPNYTPNPLVCYEVRYLQVWYCSMYREQCAEKT